MTRSSLISLIAFAGILFWIFSFSQEQIQAIQSTALTVMAPFMQGGNRVQSVVEVTGKGRLSYEDMQSEYEALKEEVMLLRIKSQQVDQLQEDNNSLHDALGYVRNSPLRLVPARVIKRNASTWYNTMIIDKGMEDNIPLESPVVTDEGLVGKIVQISNGESTVILLTDEMCQVAARVLGSTEQGILSGQRTATNVKPDLRLRYLSKTGEVLPETPVVTSGAGGVFPPNLMLGNVREFQKGPIAGEALVTPAVDFGALKNVFVIIGVKN